MKRRDMFATLGSLVTIGLAGCVSSGTSSDDDNSREPRDDEVSMDFTYEVEESEEGKMMVNCSGGINSRTDGVHVIEVTAESGGETKTQEVEVDIVYDSGWGTAGGVYEYSAVFVFDEIAPVTANAEVVAIKNSSSS